MQAQRGLGAFAAAEKVRLILFLREECSFGKVCRMTKGAKSRLSAARAPLLLLKNADRIRFRGVGCYSGKFFE